MEIAVIPAMKVKPTVLNWSGDLWHFTFKQRDLLPYFPPTPAPAHTALFSAKTNIQRLKEPQNLTKPLSK